MKKFLAVTLVLVLALGLLCACGTPEKGEKGDRGETGAMGPMGPAGVAGKDGANGKDGKNGADGANGLDGKDGKNGKSAYEIYVESHPEYTKTEDEWLDDLVNCRLADVDNVTITFNADGGVLNETTRTVVKGLPTVLPTPVKDMYNFVGWYTEGGANKAQHFTDYTPIYSDVTLIAKYELMPAVETSLIAHGIKNPDGFDYTVYGWTQNEDGSFVYADPNPHYWYAYAALQWTDEDGNTVRNMPSGKAFMLEADVAIGKANDEYSSVAICLNNNSKATSELGKITMLQVNSYFTSIFVNGAAKDDARDWSTPSTEDTTWSAAGVEFAVTKQHVKLVVDTDGSVRMYLNNNLKYTAEAGTFAGGEIGFNVYYLMEASVSNIRLYLA